jgi:hypothetical protein
MTPSESNNNNNNCAIGDVAGIGFTLALSALCPLISILVAENVSPVKFQVLESQSNDENAIKQADKDVESAAECQYFTAIAIGFLFLGIGLMCSKSKGIPNSISLGFICGFLLTIVISLYNGYDSINKLHQALIIGIVIVTLIFLSQKKLNPTSSSSSSTEASTKKDESV